MGLLKKLTKRMAGYYAREHGGIGWGWQAMDSKHCAAPLGGQKTGKNPTDIAPRTETTSRTDSILQVSLRSRCQSSADHCC
jgi:hypothetical protein